MLRLSVCVILIHFTLSSGAQALKALAPNGYSIYFQMGAQGYFNEEKVADAVKSYYPGNVNLIPIQIGVKGMADLGVFQVGFQLLSLNTKNAALISNNEYYNYRLRGNHFGASLIKDLLKSPRHDLLVSAGFNRALFNLEIISGATNNGTQAYTVSRYLNLYQYSNFIDASIQYGYNIQFGPGSYFSIGCKVESMYMSPQLMNTNAGWTQNGISGPSMNFPTFTGAGFGFTYQLGLVNRF